MSNQVLPLLGQVADTISQAIAAAHPELAGSDPVVRRSDHADFQSNAALALAKHARTNPLELAESLTAALDRHEHDPIAHVELSGPGFLNLTVPDHAIWGQLAARLASPRLGVGAPDEGLRTVIDYSAPNIAKEMHVGHLRTTIIGDNLARVLGFLGSEVIRQNHLGDWGTQFGMLIQYLDEHPETTWHHNELEPGNSAVAALDDVYKQAKAAFDADPDFAERSRNRVVALQSGDPTTIARWKEIVAESEKAFRDIYDRLGVLLTPEDSVGESFYNPLLTDAITELSDTGIAVESDGALVIFSEEVTGPDGTPAPLMVRKRDGGYGYDTTDLATIRYRIRDLKAHRLLYVTDSRQALHFQMIFEAARRAGWLTDGIEAAHIPYGTVLGPDGRPFKTRSGDTVRLMDLLDDAVARARTVVSEKNPDLPDDELNHIAEQAGIGAVKYADLSASRAKDYVFDIDRMVSFNGNTGVYLQYAHTRIRSILRKAGDPDAAIDPSVELQPAERALALELDAYGSALVEVGATLEPHKLCGYLYNLARDFTTFYEACHVLGAEEPLRTNRLALCRLTARTLQHGLGLLGISAPERM
ncbi:arginyl-tRNA synthetase [Halopolyspora algeriensis]|uniref:Arginine--tRNA ligase n=1 Tax=Halopolyspora algeriensis TaxID=1500506 RepID=A0A368VPS8_9ACTN|nr:arginine--tRNA ligase [Halopolyspora algeriensis]RCW42862.1 arginyl-tRNA synthetase [Halopolyspora algeriensis]TQM56668.1 arginyl-tRNA synthetase [Halopolyspora algeriensis]